MKTLTMILTFAGLVTTLFVVPALASSWRHQGARIDAILDEVATSPRSTTAIPVPTDAWDRPMWVVGAARNAALGGDAVALLSQFGRSPSVGATASTR